MIEVIFKNLQMSQFKRFSALISHAKYLMSGRNRVEQGRRRWNRVEEGGGG